MSLGQIETMPDKDLWKEAFLAVVAYRSNNAGENAAAYRVVTRELKRRRLWPLSGAERRRKNLEYRSVMR